MPFIITRYRGVGSGTQLRRCSCARVVVETRCHQARQCDKIHAYALMPDRVQELGQYTGASESSTSGALALGNS